MRDWLKREPIVITFGQRERCCAMFTGSEYLDANSEHLDEPARPSAPEDQRGHHRSS
jgi:hypothetical protein